MIKPFYNYTPRRIRPKIDCGKLIPVDRDLYSTDMSGFYNDVINVGSTNVIDFWLHIPDSCGTYGIWHHIHYNSTTNNFPNNDFSICHPYSGNCTTSFSYGSPTVWNTNDAQISFSSSYTGMTSNYFDRDYHWDFGDGTTNSYYSPTHNFLYDTPYNVCLTMLDETTGCMATYCDSVYIASNTGTLVYCDTTLKLTS